MREALLPTGISHSSASLAGCVEIRVLDETNPLQLHPSEVSLFETALDHQDGGGEEDCSEVSHEIERVA